MDRETREKAPLAAVGCYAEGRRLSGPRRSRKLKVSVNAHGQRRAFNRPAHSSPHALIRIRPFAARPSQGSSNITNRQRGALLTSRFYSGITE